MPLDKSGTKESVSNNIRTEMAAGKPQKQSIAIALDVARRAKRASGGAVHTGPIVSAVAGRTDHHAMDVPSGSYVIPAHVISGLGQGNTLAGMAIIKHMFPESADHPASGQADPVPIMAAGGEVVLSPTQLKAKFGNLEHAHKILDHFVKQQTKTLAKTVAKLPPPEKE